MADDFLASRPVKIIFFKREGEGNASLSPI
jgi:hypothetical protein